jgi:phage shock protein PspC (stress-responsive transcriptional regulator)
MRSTQPLRRSSTHSAIGGVCSGLARYLGLDSTLVRVGVILLTVFSGFGLALYGAAWVLIPREGEMQSILQQQLTLMRNGGSKTRLILFAVIAVVLLVVGVGVVASGGTGWLPLVAIVAAVLFARRRRRQRSAAPPALTTSTRFNDALSAWQQRLDHTRDEVAVNPMPGYMLPDSLLSAADLTPQSQGFLTPARSSLDLPDDTPWPTGPLPGAAAPLPGGAPPASTAPTGPSYSSGAYAPGPSAYAPAPQPYGPTSGPYPSAAYAPVPGGPALAYPVPPSGVPASAGPPRGPAYATADPFLQSPTLDWTGVGAVVPATPIPVSSFLAHPAPAPETSIGSTVATRRKNPAAVGWVVLLLIAGATLGLCEKYGASYWTNPVAVGGTAVGILGAALTISPWTGRPRWLAPLSGLLVAGGVGALFVLSFFSLL